MVNKMVNNMSGTLSIRIKDETLAQTDRLKKRFGAPSRSDVIRRAVELSDSLANAIQHGDKVIIETKNGSRREVILPGLKNEK
jgi:Arc/MetJ-type ribon-helix-helix transcriptional regulator